MVWGEDSLNPTPSGAGLVPDRTWRQLSPVSYWSPIPVAYADNFVPIRHSFLVDPRYTAAEKTVLIWLASKPEDWDVKQDQVCKELNLGRKAAGTILRDLRDKGAISKPAPERDTGGRWVSKPGRLTIRHEIRHVTAGRTGLPVAGIPSGVVLTKEGRTNERNVRTYDGQAEPGRTNRDVAYDPWAVEPRDTSEPAKLAVALPSPDSSSTGNERSSSGEEAPRSFNSPGDSGEGYDHDLDALQERWRKQREDREEGDPRPDWRKTLHG